MEMSGAKIGRIVEPFVKVSYALWIVDRGAVNVKISVDGAETNPEQVAEILMSKGYVREPLTSSNVSWTGRFSLQGKSEVVVSSQPGVDISATFKNKRLLVAECKGEPTPTAVRSGLDRTAFYAAIGQLIIISGNLQPQPQQKVIVLADTDRLRALASYAIENTLLKQIRLSFALVDRSGNVSEIQST
jgi:hypothetical protein